MKTKKRILSAVLTLVMMLGMFSGMSLTASAEGDTQEPLTTQLAAEISGTEGYKLIVNWTITYNPEAKVSAANTTVTDQIGTNAQEFMKYHGIGMTVSKYNGDGNQVGTPEEVRYADLTQFNDGAWTYTVPETDTAAYKYVITYQTEVDQRKVNETGETKWLANSANGTEGGVTVEPTEGSLEISLTHDENYTETSIPWNAAITVPACGLSRAEVVIFLPAAWINGQRMIDTVVNGSVNIEGLQDGEAYTIDDSGVNDTQEPNVRIMFYKDPGKQEPGFRGSTGSEARDIGVKFTTGVDQDWLTAEMDAQGWSEHAIEIKINNTSASDEVTFGTPPLARVTITAGDNMTKTADSGDALQNVMSGAMTDVVFTADEGYYFPTDYSVASVDGVSVTRDSYSQITVSGTPTANVAITLAAPTAKTKPEAPSDVAAVGCTSVGDSDGKLTGVTTAMEYKKSDAVDWTEGTGNDITGLVPGTYYVRVKATDTTLASDHQELMVTDYLTAVKTAAKAELDTLLAGKDETEYDEADWTALTQAVTDGKAAIDGAATVNAVAEAKADAAAAVNAVQTREEKEIDSFDKALSDISEINAENKDSIKAFLAAYDQLTDEMKEAVDEKIGRAGWKKLSDLEMSLDVAERIEALKEAGDITAGDEKAILIARTAYDMLSDPQKAFISEELILWLEAAEDKLEELKEQAALEAARAAAVEKLQDYAAVKALSDATQDEKKTYDDAVAEGILKINAAETKEAVMASLADARAAVDAVLAKIARDRADAAAAEAAAAEMTAADEALADAKAAATEAVKAADAALADEYVSENDQNAINAAKNTLASAVEAADDLAPDAAAEDKRSAAGVIEDAVKALTEAVDTAKVNSAAAKQEAAAAASRLAEAKETASGRLEDYSEAKALADATQDEKKAYDDVVAAEILKINAAETPEAVEAALTAAKKAVDDKLAEIRQDRADAAAAEAAAAEMTAADEALAAVKTAATEAVKAANAALADEYVSEADQKSINSAKNKLASAVDAANNLVPDASAAEKNAAAKAIEDAVKVLDKATDTAIVNSAAAKQEEATAAEQLAAAKEIAVGRLTDYAEAKALSDATQDEKRAYDDVAATELLKINAAETTDAVAATLTAARKAVDERLAEILKARADAAAAAAEMAAADQALAAAEAYAERIYADAENAAEDEYVIDADKAALNEAMDALYHAVKAADELPGNASAAVKNAAAKAITDAAEALASAVEEAEANSAAARADAEAKAAAASRLAAAKAAALERLEDYSEAKAKSDASTAESKAYNKAVTAGKTAIRAAADVPAVTAALTEAKRTIDEAVIKIEEDRAAVATVTAAIKALPAADDISVSERDVIKAAREAYEKLTGDQRSQITAETILKLNEAEAALAAAEKYSSEWIKGKWYNKDGTRTYAGIGRWKKYSKGWKYVDSLGWNAKNQWQKIDGKWYFFDKEGYMEADAYRQGYHLTKDGNWDDRGTVPGWTKDDKGWYYSLGGNDCLKNGWQKIDGKWYYFKADGYAAQSEFIQGMWFNKNCLQSDPVKYDWFEDNQGWWYGAEDGWYAKNSSYIIDGVSYSFNSRGYCINR